MSDHPKPSPTPTRTQLATAPTVLISPGASGKSGPRRVLAPRTRWQRFFSRDNLQDLAKTLAIVVPVTLLIWGWAEREQVQEKNFRVTLRPIARSDQIARVERPNVEITLSGPNSGLDAFARRLREENSEIAVESPRVDTSVKEETRTVNVSDLLADQKLIRDAGLTVKGGTDVEFVIDKVEERPIEIRRPADLNLEVATEPATAILKGPRAAMAELPVDAYAVLAPTNLAELKAMTTPGTTKRIADVPIRLAFATTDRAITLTPERVVSATFTAPEALEDRSVINYFVAVRADIPLDLLQKRVRDNKPAIVVTGNLQGIAVIGPRDVVAKVDSEEFKKQVFARITLTRDDLVELDAGKTLDVKPEILLPPGVRIDGAVPSVKVSAPLGGSTDANP